MRRLRRSRGRFVCKDIKKQTRRALENIKTIIEAAGGSLDGVVQVGVFLTGAKDWPLMNEVYVEYFSKDFPARTAVVVELATRGALRRDRPDRISRKVGPASGRSTVSSGRADLCDFLVDAKGIE